MTTLKNSAEPSPVSSPVSVHPLQALDLSQIIEPVKDDLSVVEEWLETNLVDDNPFIAELLGQIFRAGGKRIRPAVVLLCSHASLDDSRPFSRLHIILAVLTELIHAASLVHDDVIDSASLRRGQETVNRRWNDRVAVLMGDLLFAQASICLARIMNPVVVGIYGQVLGDLCAGEIRQMRQQFSTDLRFEDYIKKSINKTASLFAAGAHSGAILNAKPDSEIIALKEYGLNLGLCFQIVDDLLDVIGESNTMGKMAGSDLRGGVLTAPALYLLEEKSTASSRLEELVRSRTVCSDEGSEEALSLIRNSSAIERTFELAKELANKGRTSLLTIAPSNYRDSLEALLDYVLTRAN
jgi:all-trans-nonaprenyl-diphosphate synthase